ncbi:solute carrier family 31 (copper transporter), member 1, partial [Lecanoromycetidae sp. Uapishka_2]
MSHANTTMSHDTMSHDTMSPMQMVFYTSTSTPLFTTQWTPTNPSTYAGACIFLIILAIIFQGLLAGKSLLERYWSDSQPLDRNIATLGDDRDAAKRDGGSEGQVEAWRLSVELPRALYVTVMAGVSYLL